MRGSVTCYLDNAVEQSAGKIAFTDDKEKVTYKELYERSVRVADVIEENELHRCPVAIFMPKSVNTVAVMMGIAYSGNFYTIIDTAMPNERIRRIIDVFEPNMIITCDRYAENCQALDFSGIVVNADDIVKELCPVSELARYSTRVHSSDALYVLFTSGSTGIPKGVVSTHGAVISYVDTVTDFFGITSDDVLGNQVDFYFVMAVFDIYVTLKVQATCHIMPREYFFRPAKLFRFVNENRLTFLNWSCSALRLMEKYYKAGMEPIDSVATIAFGGETISTHIIKRLSGLFNNATFVNTYGATEMTDSACYFVIDKNVDLDVIPIGKAFADTEIILIDEFGKVIDGAEVGELCVRSDQLSLGYYNEPELTMKKYIQNPIHNKYRDIVFMSGDLARRDKNGDYIYIGRKDNQISRHGFRIELGDIEACTAKVGGVNECCCIYDNKGDRMLLIYSGQATSDIVRESICELLPDYMMPDRIENVNEMAHTLSGKPDRQQLMKEYFGQ